MAKTRSEYYTRTRLLNQLGLFQPLVSKSTPTPTPVETHCSNQECKYHTSILGDAIPFETKLNDSFEDDNKALSLCHSSFRLSTCSSIISDNSFNHHAVRFKDTVSVIPIPSRYQYSDRIKQCVWSNRMELREMAQRNLMEYEAEGFDWRNVVVEEDMYIDATNGDLIHPCHLQLDDPPLDGSISKMSTGDETDTSTTNEQEGGEDEEDDLYFFAPLRRLESFAVV